MPSHLGKSLCCYITILIKRGIPRNTGKPLDLSHCCLNLWTAEASICNGFRQDLHAVVTMSFINTRLFSIPVSVVLQERLKFGALILCRRCKEHIVRG